MFRSAHFHHRILGNKCRYFIGCSFIGSANENPSVITKKRITVKKKPKKSKPVKMNYSLSDKLNERDLAPIIKHFFDQNGVSYRTKISDQMIHKYDVIITERKWKNRRERRELASGTKNLVVGEIGNDIKIDLKGEISVEINTQRTVTISFDVKNDHRTMALSFLHYMTKSLPL